MTDMSLSLFQQMVDELPVGVVLLDASGSVVHYNRAEERLSGRTRDAVLGRLFFSDVAPCMNVREMGHVFRDGIGRTTLQTKVEFAFPFAGLERPRDVVVELRSFQFNGAPYGCLFIEDISSRRTIERLKDNLSEMLIHDLKNPLSAILANIDFAVRALSPKESPDIVEALVDSSIAAQRLRAMLLTLLDVSRLETNTMPIKRVDLDLRTLVGAVVREGEAVARERAIDLIGDLPAHPVMVSIDIDLVRRSIDNLVENAIRHARRAIRVGIIVDANSHVQLEVIDDGPGVPVELRESIFEKHVQVADGRAQRDNRGLGLTFVRLAARSHGGDVKLTCDPGKGSRFTLDFAMRANVK